MAGIQIDGVNNKIDFDDDADTSISSATDDTLVFEIAGSTTAQMTNGDFLINTTTAIQPGSSGGLGVKGDINISDFTADTSSSALVFTKSRNTTPGSQTIVNNGDQVGAIFFKADDGDASDYNNNVAAITASVDAAPGTNDTPGRLAFFTTNDGERTNTERMRIDSDGLVGIGTTSPSPFRLLVDSDSSNNGVAKFNHSHGTPEGIRVVFSAAAPDNTSANFLECTDSSATRLQIQAQGNVQNHDNSYGQISDERIKSNIKDANSQWDDIKAIKVRNFERKDDIEKYGEGKKVQIGLIAQECELVSPKLVNEQRPSAGDIRVASEFGTLYEDGDTIPEGKEIGDVKEVKEQVKAISYSVLYMKAIKALQEAMTRIEELETKVAALEGN